MLSPQLFVKAGKDFSDNGYYVKAIKYYEKAIEKDPEFGCAYNSLAWLQATCPESRYRDGKKAVVNAKKGCELVDHGDASHYAGHLDTLACAYAEEGDYSKAIKNIRKAIDLVRSDERQQYKDRLKLIKAKKPYHRQKK